MFNYTQSQLSMIVTYLFLVYPMQEPKWCEEAIEGHGSVEVNISHAIFTGGSRVGKTSLKHYLLHNTAREDKTSTGVLEAPEVDWQLTAQLFHLLQVFFETVSSLLS